MLRAIIIVAFASVSLLADRTVIQYSSFDGHPVELVIDHSSKCATLQVRAPKSVLLPLAAVRAALAREAIRLSTGRPVPLGSTGYTFTLKEGRPIWAPYSMTDGDNDLVRNYFAESAEIAGKSVTAKGTDDPGSSARYAALIRESP